MNLAVVNQIVRKESESSTRLKSSSRVSKNILTGVAPVRPHSWLPADGISRDVLRDPVKCRGLRLLCDSNGEG